MHTQFKNVNVGDVFTSSGTVYTKINGRQGRITMPGKPYHGRIFYFGYSNLCRIIGGPSLEHK